MLIATVFIYVAARRARDWWSLPWKGRAALGLIGLTFAIHWMTYFWSIKLSSAQMATIGVSTFGVFVSILGAAFLSHRVRLFHFIGLAFALAGTLLVVGTPDGINMTREVAIGFGLGIVSGFFYALLPLWHQTFKHIPTSQRTLGQNLFGLLFFLPFAPLGNWQLDATNIAGLIYLGLVGTVLCHTLWIRATTALPTTHSGIIYYLYVPSGCAMGYFLLGERLTLLQISGAVLIVTGSLIGIGGEAIRQKFRSKASPVAA